MQRRESAVSFTAIAPVWAVCDACGCPCAGETVMELHDGKRTWYMHADEAACYAAWEAASAQRARLKVFVEVDE